MEEKTRFQEVVDEDREAVGVEKGFKNIKRYSELSEEEKHNLHVIGGKARAKQRRERRTLKEDLLKVLDSTEIATALAKVNGNPLLIQATEEGANVQELVTLATLMQCLEGNTKTIEYLRDTIGEKPKDEVEINADIVTSADRKLIENLRKRVGIVQDDEENAD